MTTDIITTEFRDSWYAPRIDPPIPAHWPVTGEERGTLEDGACSAPVSLIRPVMSITSGRLPHSGMPMVPLTGTGKFAPILGSSLIPAVPILPP